jgi:Fe-S cluster assembly protein SufD
MVGFKNTRLSGAIMVNWHNNDISTLAADLPGGTTPWLVQLRAQQWQRFLSNGLPTRQHEAWKYTDIKSFGLLDLSAVTRDITPMASTDSSASGHELVRPEQAVESSTTQPQLVKPKNAMNVSTIEQDLIRSEKTVDAIHLTFVDGQLVEYPTDLPPGVVICDLRSALVSHPEAVQRGFAEHQESAAGMVNLNTSLWQNGLFISLADNVSLERPIMVRYTTAIAASVKLNVLRNMIFVGKNSELTLFQDFSSDNTLGYWQQVINQIDLAEHAKLNHFKCQNEGEQATHLSENLIQQAACSIINSTSFALGAKLQREAWQVNLCGREARCECRGLVIANNTQHSDFHVTMNHNAPACHSEQIFKAIATDKSRTVFNGKVIVQPTGQQTEAHQLSQNLLLSALAEIDTRPELEIYTDDVKCSHGASVGQLDPDALFYLQSRGISEVQANEMLLHAFAQDQLAESLPLFQQLIAPIIDKKLALINGGQRP